MPKTFEDLKFVPHQVRPMFDSASKLELDNGYGISVINGSSAYCGADTYEVAILKDGELTYDTKFTDDVLGHQSPADINELLINLEKLK